MNQSFMSNKNLPDSTTTNNVGSVNTSVSEVATQPTESNFSVPQSMSQETFSNPAINPANPLLKTTKPLSAFSQDKPSNSISKAQHSRFFLMILSFFIFILLITITALPVYTSVNFPFVSLNNQKILALFYYKIPFLPKTPQQILLAASNTDSVLTTYNPDFSFSATLSGASIKAASLDFKLSGPLDFSQPNKPKFDIVAEAGVNFAGTSYQAKGQIRGIGNNIYFKLNSLSDSVVQLVSGFGTFFLSSQTSQRPTDIIEIKNNLQQVFANWINYDTSGLDTEARKVIESQSKTQSLIDTNRRQVQEFLLRKDITPEVVLVGKEELEGTLTYHLVFEPSSETLRTVLTEYLNQKDIKNISETETLINSIVSSVEIVKIEAWFGVQDSLPRKSIVQMQFNLNSLFSNLTQDIMRNQPYGSMAYPFFKSVSSSVLSISSVLNIRDIGKPVAVDIPSPTLTIGEYTSKVQQATKTQEQVRRETRKKQIDTNLRTMKTQLFKYYVDNRVYPVNLSSLFGNQYSDYQYRIKDNNKGYVLFLEYKPSSYSYRSSTTPYYGISSSSTYPHQLRQSDFD